ncbi:hypothetical protein EJB05_56088, partial [Eragrostis curvula]
KPCGTHTPGTGALFFLIFRFPSELACAPRSTQLSSSTPLLTEDGNASPVVSSSFSLSCVALLLSPSFANTRSTPPWPLSTERRRAAATAHLCSSSSHPRVHLNLLYLLEEQEHQADHYTESNSRITPASSPTNHLGFTVKFDLHICSTSELFFPVLLDVHTYHAGVLHDAFQLQNQRVNFLVYCSERSTSPNVVFPPPLAAGHLPVSLRP